MESGGPFEGGGCGGVVALHVAGEAGGGFGVGEVGVAEDFSAECGEAGVVVDEFLAGVDVVVIVVWFAVVSEP